jgi:tRNA1Val (adenine37-N6)-methyltransferase
MSVFKFKQFSITQNVNAMKVGTDAMVLGASIEADAPKNILDVGSGTGVISLMLAQRFLKSIIQAVEIDHLSARECELNFQQSKWTKRLSVHQADFLKWSTDETFDLVVSNPPFYQSTLENADGRAAAARHESALPMDGMLQKIESILTENGAFWVIVPSEYEARWKTVAMRYQLHCNSEIMIFGKEGGTLKRCILKFQRFPKQLVTSKFFIRDSEGKYSPSYIELTREFHFNDLSAHR